jgi:putative membrane protein
MDMNGWNWVWMSTMFVVFWGVVVAVVVVLLRHTRAEVERHEDTAEETLRQRLARGEIDIDEFHRRLNTLRA